MRHYLYPAAAAFLAVACTEPTAPSSAPLASPELRSSFTTAGTDFSAGSSLPSGFSLSSSATTVSPSGQTYLGPFRNEQIVLSVPANSGAITVAFNLYVVGTWDGYGGKKYGSDTWGIVARCVGSTRTLSGFETDFSNKTTTLQHYPNASTGALNAGLSGSIAQNSLGYNGTAGDQTKGAQSAADATYAIQLRLASNNCSQGVQFVLRSPTQQLQYDETWGIDNLQVTGN